MHIAHFFNRRPSPPQAGWGYLVSTIIAGATVASFAKQLMTVFSPLSMLFLSEAFMLLFVILSFGFFPLLYAIQRMQKRLFVPLLSVAVLTGIVAPLLWFRGLQSTTAVNGELFSMSETLFLVLFSIILLHERVGMSRVFGAIIIASGIMTIALRGTFVMVPMAGDLLIVAGCVFYAFGGIIISRYLRSIDPSVIILLRSGTAVLAFFLISPFIASPLALELKRFPLEWMPVLLAYGFVSRFIYIFSYYEAIERLPVSVVSLLSTTMIVFSTLFASLYLREPLETYHIAGVALLLLGAGLVRPVGKHRDQLHVHHGGFPERVALWKRWACVLKHET